MIFALAACGKPPPPATPKGPPIPGVDYTWKIIGHVLTQAALIDERDAVAWNGREITITATGYASPFQGTCEQASKIRRARQLSDVVMDLDAPRSIITDYDFAGEVTEYKLTCRERKRPTLEIWVDPTGERALTCFSGVCYFLRR